MPENNPSVSNKRKISADIERFNSDAEKWLGEKDNRSRLVEFLKNRNRKKPLYLTLNAIFGRQSDAMWNSIIKIIKEENKKND